MYLVDFEYDGEMLSGYDCIPASINNSFSDSVSLRNELNLETVKVRDNNKIITATYSDVQSVTFDISKKICNGEEYFTEDDIRCIVSWLDKKKYCKFKPFYDDGSYVDTFFRGIFTDISIIKIGGNVVGFSLTLTADSPYGYFDIEGISHSLTATDNSFNIYNYSEEYGFTYPDEVIIQCNQAGNVILINNQDENHDIVIRNCIKNEIITLDCVHKIITSDKTHSTLYNDFNYNWLRLVNTKGDICNTITLDSSGIKSAVVTVNYAPIRKVGLII